MAQTVSVEADNPITEGERKIQLQYIQDNLNDQELEKLYQLAKMPKARKALVTKFNFIKNFL